MTFRLERTIAIASFLALALFSTAPTSLAGFQDAIDIDTLPEGVAPRGSDITVRAELALTQADQKVADEGMGAGDAEYQTALDRALEELTNDPGNPLGLYQAGRAYLGLRDYVKADSMFTEAVRLHPRYVVEVNPRRENAWIDAYNLGVEASQLGNTDEAVRQWERAGVIYDRRPEALLNLGNNLATRDTERAIDFFDRALQILTDPGNRAAQDTATLGTWDRDAPTARLNLAVLYLQGERWADARPQLEELIRANPDNTEALSYLSLTLTNLGMADSAAVISERLMGGAEMGPMELAAMGANFYNAQNYGQAAEAFRRVLEAVPQHRDAAFYYAQSLYLIEDWEALEQASTTLRGLDPNGLGWIRFGVQAYAATGRDTEPFTDAASNLAFTVDQLTFTPVPEGATVGGLIQSNTVAEGTPIDLTFYFFGADGSDLGSASVQVPAPAPGVDGAEGAPVQFGVQVETDELVVGYRYEVNG